MKLLYLHIGVEKTGSTAIQVFLSRNREQLSQLGYTVPLSLGSPNARKAAAIANDPGHVDRFFLKSGLADPELRGQSVKAWTTAFVEEIEQSRTERFILSNEHLQSQLRRPSEVGRLADILGKLFTKIIVVAYIRNPVERIVSSYSTAVKCGNTEQHPRPPNHPYEKQCTHYKNLCMLWHEHFEELRLRIYERESFYQNDLIKDFCQTVDLPWLETFQQPTAENKSISRLGLALLSRVNARILEFVDGKPTGKRGNLVNYFEKHFSKGPRFQPDPDWVRECNQFYASSNEWVRAQYFPERSSLFRDTPISEACAPCATDESELDQIAELISDIWIEKNKYIKRLQKDHQI